MSQNFGMGNAFHLLCLGTINLPFVWYVCHLEWQNVEICSILSRDHLQALNKEHNNCSATHEASCKLSYVASFPLLHFSCHRSVNDQQLLRWHSPILIHFCVLGSLELNWFTSSSVVCWLPYLGKYLCSPKTENYKCKWDNLFYLTTFSW